jgi:hypothetical protein
VAVVAREDGPLRAGAEGISPEHALLGFDGVHTYSHRVDQAERMLTEAMDLTMTAPGNYVLEGGRRRASYAHDEQPSAVGIQGQAPRITSRGAIAIISMTPAASTCRSPARGRRQSSIASTS